MATLGTHSYQYPFAHAPELIRAYQKDAYFQSHLFDSLSDIQRRLCGARFAHAHTSSTRTISELLYHFLTTLIGNRTLGEEYCDIIQIEANTGRLPSLFRRASYILTSILVPYGLTRLLPSLRRRLRSLLESSLGQNSVNKSPHSSTLLRLQQYALTHLDTLINYSPIYAVSLATFYFTGSYYHLSKRYLSLRYIFTRHPPSNLSSAPHVGYEVLGVLLVAQLAVQVFLHLHQNLSLPKSTPSHTLAHPTSLDAGGNTTLVDGTIELTTESNANASSPPSNALPSVSTPTQATASPHLIEQLTNTPLLDENQARYSLDDDTTMGWFGRGQQRKCTLCLESMRDPSMLTCGHVFCWICIRGWIGEKAECPLCRGKCLAQHILPLRS